MGIMLVAAASTRDPGCIGLVQIALSLCRLEGVGDRAFYVACRCRRLLCQSLCSESMGGRLCSKLAIISRRVQKYAVEIDFQNSGAVYLTSTWLDGIKNCRCTCRLNVILLRNPCLISKTSSRRQIPSSLKRGGEQRRTISSAMCMMAPQTR